MTHEQALLWLDSQATPQQRTSVRSRLERTLRAMRADFCRTDDDGKMIIATAAFAVSVAIELRLQRPQ